VRVYVLILNTTHVQPHSGVAQRLGLAIDGLYDYEWPQLCINPSVQLAANSRQMKADKSNPAAAKRMEEDEAVAPAAKGYEEEAGEKAAADSKVVIPCESPAMPPLDKFSAVVLLYA
jgi:hypothetical protein